MRNSYIYVIIPEVLDINKLTDTQSPTDGTGLYSFIDLDVLLLRRRLVDFTYRQSEKKGKGQSYKRFCRTPF